MTITVTKICHSWRNSKIWHATGQSLMLLRFRWKIFRFDSVWFSTSLP